MSTKLYNAFKMKDESGLDAFKVLENLRDFKKQLLPISQKGYNFEICQRLVRAYDNYTANQLFDLSYADSNPNPPTIADIIIDYIKESSDKNNLVLDLEFTIACYPYNDKEWLMIPFYNYNEYENCLQSQSWYVDYSYWDNTDRPDEISQEEWDQREETWKKVVGYFHIPANETFCMKVANNNHLVVDLKHQTYINELLSIPEFSDKRRVNRMRENLSLLIYRKNLFDAGATQYNLKDWLDAYKNGKFNDELKRYESDIEDYVYYNTVKSILKLEES